MSYVPFLLTAFVVWVLSLFLAKSPPGPISVDHQRNITYYGLSANGVDTFLNIPFGQNTGGTGRFAPPKPFISPHNSIVNATVPGPVCPQNPTQFAGLNTLVNANDISEDCLNLRISRPASIAPNAKLPVMAYIYGGTQLFFLILKQSNKTILGGYEFGNIYDPLYTPDGLIRSSVDSGSPVIYVAMNYRIGSK
jgi:carboxylesterase type B